MTILRAFINSLGVAPTAAATVPNLAALQIPMTDGTYLTGAQMQAVLGTSSGGGGGTAPAAPGQVTGLTAGTPTASTIPLSWTPPSTGGTPTGYTVTYTPAGGSAATVSVTGTSTTLTGLTASKAHAITVAATNAGGTGTASASITATTLAAAGGNPGVQKLKAVPYYKSSFNTGPITLSNTYQGYVYGQLLDDYVHVQKVSDSSNIAAGSNALLGASTSSTVPPSPASDNGYKYDGYTGYDGQTSPPIRAPTGATTTFYVWMSDDGGATWSINLNAQGAPQTYQVVA